MSESKEFNPAMDDYSFVALSKIVRYWREETGPEAKQHYLFWQSLRNQLYPKQMEF